PRFQLKIPAQLRQKTGRNGWAGSPLHAVAINENLSIAGIPYQPGEWKLLPLLWQYRRRLDKCRGNRIIQPHD
ncbi:MAG: hypothetical protein WCS94_21425, partial [Verrucomicrobiota bacterium]